MLVTSASSASIAVTRPARMTAVVPAHRCGAVPVSHRVPSYDTPPRSGVNQHCPPTENGHDICHRWGGNCAREPVSAGTTAPAAGPEDSEA
jgi:hypothetical protein